jgi:hypothetical protein
MSPLASPPIVPPGREPLSQRLGAILWPSFFSAGVSTMVFFAFVDPLALRDMTFPSLPMTRELGYTLGFFLFWLATGAASLFTWVLLRPAGQLNSRSLRD